MFGKSLMLSVVMVLVLGTNSSPRGAITNPLQGKHLYVNPKTPARLQAIAWQKTRPDDAARMLRLAEQPHAIWVGEWDGNVRRFVEGHMNLAVSSRALPVFVAYNIPHRDCGLHSRGGADGGNAYRRWVIEFARGLKSRPSVVILEPDGIAAIDCLPARLRDERYALLREAVEVLTKAGAVVYVDAGNANWQQPGEMANRLRSAGVERAHGFALNVSNFHATHVNVTYGTRLSGTVGGKHFIIDTSRNGRGALVEKEWCNAPNQALGRFPTTETGIPLVDAFLYVKTPGQSDGTCNGGPRAGEWWADYALGLIKNAEALRSTAQR